MYLAKGSNIQVAAALADRELVSLTWQEVHRWAVSDWFRDFPMSELWLGDWYFLGLFLMATSGCRNSKHIKTAIGRGRRQGYSREQMVSSCTPSSHQEVNLSQNIFSAKTPYYTGGSRLRAGLTCTAQWLVTKNLEKLAFYYRESEGK